MRAFLLFLPASAVSLLPLLFSADARAVGPSTPPPMPPTRGEAQTTPSAPGDPRRTSDVAPSSWLVDGLGGFEVEVSGLVIGADPASPVLAPHVYPPQAGDPNGDLLRGTEKPYGPDLLGVALSAGYRLLPALSAGVTFRYASLGANDGTDTGNYPDTTSQLQREFWQLGVYARYYLTTLSPRLHPWVELAVGYTEDTASYVRGSTQNSSGQPATIDYYLTYSGLVTGLRLGLDWRVAPFFSVGPTLGYERVFALRGCVDVEPQSDQFNMSALQAVSTCSTSTVQTSGYGVFLGGLFAKLTFGPTLR